MLQHRFAFRQKIYSRVHAEFNLNLLPFFLLQLNDPDMLEGKNKFSADARPIARTHAAMVAVAPLIGFNRPVFANV